MVIATIEFSMNTYVYLAQAMMNDSPSSAFAYVLMRERLYLSHIQRLVVQHNLSALAVWIIISMPLDI